MSYLKPKKWYMYFLNLITRHQDKDIQYQYSIGIRVFDIRVRIIKGVWYFSNNSIIYKGYTIPELFDYLNERKDCHVRLVLEDSNKLNSNIVFYYYAQYWIKHYPNIDFFQSVCKHELCKHITNVYAGLSYTLRTSSVSYNKLYNIFPLLYAKLNNRENILEANADKNNKRYMFIDFVGHNY